MAELLDFQIDTMKFRLAVDNTAYSSTNTGRPYRRSTAQFRKEQYDTSATPGDNSLTGWWARAQLSFHKGAGLKYYEVLEGDGILNRFTDSCGVDALSTPGEMYALAATVDVTTDPITMVNDAVMIGDSLYGAIDDNGVLREMYQESQTSTPLTTKTLAGGGSVVRIAASEDSYFAATTVNNVERFSPDGTRDAILYSYTGTLSGVWYAKSRLWIIAQDGSVFAVSANPTGTLPIALSNPVARVTDLSISPPPTDMTTLTETPGGVYIARGGGSIFRIGLASDGSVPTLSEAVVSAVMPDGESIQCLQYYLGMLAILTYQGFRLAQVDDSTGSVIYGPAFIEALTTDRCRRMATWGTNIIFVASGDVYCVDLSGPVSSSENPLVFPYARWAYGPTGNLHVTGVSIGSHFKRYMFIHGDSFQAVNSGKDSSGSRIASGAVLYTAYHRFGTLDEKSFQTVVVRTTGWEGTLTVSQCDLAGNETVLGTVDAGSSTELPFVTTTGVEALSLKFEWTAGSFGYGPGLLGYQIKALPVPKRQRMIEVPLLMRDVFKTRTGVEQGRTGNGWDQLQALEALESSKAIVPYTDFRTGETGTAYIDGVEFYGDNLTSPGDRSFGGIAYVALRVIS